MKTKSGAGLCATAFVIFAVLISCQTASTAKGALSGDGRGKRTYELKFKYAQGEDYSYSLEVKEEVRYDGKLTHRAEITDRVRTHVADIVGTRARILATVEVTETVRGQGREPFKETTRYETECWRDELGEYHVGDEEFMPVVRNVPVFPKRPLSQGESWSAPAEEVHDFRRSFSVEQPVHVPFVANYKLERIERKGAIAVILINYRIDSAISIGSRPSVYPERMSGYSEQVLRWNVPLGLVESAKERFSFTLCLSNGHEVTFSGSAKGSRVE